MIELTAQDFCDFYNMLPSPYAVEQGVMASPIDKPKEVTITGSNGKRCTFKLNHIGEYIIEWQPTEDVIIKSKL